MTVPAPEESGWQEQPEKTGALEPSGTETEGMDGEEQETSQESGAAWTDEFWKWETGIQETEAGSREETVSGAAPSSEGGTPAWPWLLGGGVLLALAILLLWRLLRPGKPAEAGAQETPSIKRREAGIVQVGNLHHIGDREEQQDSFAISDISDQDCVSRKGSFAVMADGMGGLLGGGQISAIVTSAMLRAFESTRDLKDGEIPELLLRMVQQANREVLRFLDSGQGRGGSTVTAVWALRGRIYFISVGDSRICLIREGTLTVLNREHIYGTELDELAARGEISWEEAGKDPQRNALTSYIGMSPLKKIDRSIHGFLLLPGDKIVLMSDGVFGTLSDEEILEEARGSAGEMADMLQKRILEKKKQGQDNFTAVILQCG